MVKQVALQPRQTPPKAAERQQQREILQAKAAQAAAAAQAKKLAKEQTPPAVPSSTEPPTGAADETTVTAHLPSVQFPITTHDDPDETLDGQFPDLSDAFGAMPNAALVTPATNPVAAAQIGNASGNVQIDPKAKVLSTQHQIVNNPDSETARPPRTRSEYVQQQRMDNVQYPDVADLFMGQAGIMPESGLLDLKRPEPPPAPLPPQTIVIEHRVPEEILAYRFTRDADLYIGDSFQHFSRGDLIYDTYVIDSVLAGGFDGLVPEQVAKDFEICPQCRHQFPPGAAKR